MTGAQLGGNQAPHRSESSDSSDSAWVLFTVPSVLVNEPDPKKAWCGFPQPTAQSPVVGGVLVAHGPQPAGQLGKLGKLEGIPAQQVLIWTLLGGVQRLGVALLVTAR